MSIQIGGYVGAKTCTGTATPGARALMAWYLGAYADDGAANLGIYLCKDIAGTSTTSLHGEGRACDLGSTPYHKLPFMDDVADALVANSHELGIQCVIHDGQIWSSSYPHAGWRDYHGVDPHRGHIHAELMWWAAQSLTVNKINQILGTGVVTRPTPSPSTDWTRRLIVALPELKKGQGMPPAKPNEDVQTMQNLLQARGHYTRLKTADGRFGNDTEADLKEFQKASKITADGICGKVTWAYLLRQPGAAK
jgi:hypothetical protein